MVLTRRPLGGAGGLTRPAGTTLGPLHVASGPIRVGVIGTGFGATVHIPALKQLPDIDLVAVCSKRPERAAAVAAQHGIPIAISDYRELVRDPELQAVVVATPPYLHHQMVVAAIEAGKHVLCEKPMARSLAEARDMVKLARDIGVVAMVNHEFRFLPVRARIKELIDAGYLGEPHAACLTVFRSTLNDPLGRPFTWLMEQEKAGGMLGAAGSHAIDALRWWFGEIKAVAGATATMVKRRRLPDSSQMGKVDADDNFAFVVKFAGGALGSVHYSATAAVDSGDEIILSGSEGMLMAHGDAELYGARRGEGHLAQIALPEPPRDEPAGEQGHHLIAPTVRLLRVWVQAIRTGETASPSFEDGAKVQEVLDGVVRSGTQNRWIDTSGTRWPLAG